MGPEVQCMISQISHAVHAVVLCILLFVAGLLISYHSVLLTSVLVCTLAFISLLCPMWLVRIQKFKAKINGPWDEAQPKLSASLSM